MQREVWKHNKCDKLGDTTYDAIRKSNKARLQYLCSPCNKTAVRVVKPVICVSKKVENIEERVTKVESNEKQHAKKMEHKVEGMVIELNGLKKLLVIYGDDERTDVTQEMDAVNSWDRMSSMMLV